MFRTIIVLLVLIVLGSMFSLASFGQAKLPASPIKTVYITPFSHYDFGFVEPPDQVRERAARHIDEVIRVAEEEPDFRWTIESVWQVNEWLKRQRRPESVLPKDKARIERLMKLIRSGRITMSMAWGSMHTDFMSAEELNRLVYGFKSLSKTYNIPSELAMMNDVPGHPSSLPSVMAGSDVKYMVTGANTFIGVATSVAPGKVPFYWEGPDGSKVLLWVSQGNRGAYVEAVTEFYLDPFSLDPYTGRRPFEMFNPEMIGKTTPIQEMEIGMTNLLKRYNEAGYKYDAVMAMYSHDFVEPTDVLNLKKAVALWKKHHPEIELKIATPNEFFKHIEAKYAREIPTFKGEWSGLWSEAKTQSPVISARARYNHDHLPAAEALWSALAMTRKVSVPVGNFASVLDLMFTYDEHSGAGNNGWPQLNSRWPLEEQNRQYVRFTGEAAFETKSLLDKGVRMLAEPTRYETPAKPKAGRRPLVVYNALSWPRSDLVSLKPPAASMRVEKVVDVASNSELEFDVDDDGSIIFLARDVPSMGFKTFEVEIATGASATTLKTSGSTSIANARYSVEATPAGHIKSIRETTTERELVNAAGELPFNELLRVEGQDASKVTYPVEPRVTARQGRVIKRLEIARPGSAFPLTTISLADGLDRVDLRNELDRTKMPFVGGNNNWNDSYYFAFPLSVSTSGLKVVRGGHKWFDMLPDDYLPGARWDSVTTQHLIGMTDGAKTALVAHRQPFHWVFPSFVPTKIRPKNEPVGFPAMFTGKFPLPEATLYSRAIRHSSQADTHDMSIVNLDSVEPGVTGNLVFDYAFGVGAGFDAVAAWRLGGGFNVPLIAKYTSVAPAESFRGFFAVDQPNVAIVTVKALADSVIKGEVSSAPLNPPVNKVFTVRLQEFAGREATVRVSVPVKVRSAALTNLTEDREIAVIDQVSPVTVAIKPYQTLTVRIEIE